MIEIIKKQIDITPHHSILVKISQTGYSVQEAIAELIDNAIDARINEQKLTIVVEITPEKIVISDNGTGMSEEQAVKAIRLGFSEKKNQLGEFGLGLKTATAFLGKKFELYTTPLNHDEEYVIEHSEDDWLQNGDWRNYPFIVRKGVEKDRSGTTVIVTELKNNLSEKLLKNIKDEFGARFGPFVKNSEVDLVFNGELCQHSESSLIDNNKNEFIFEFNGGKATGWWGYQLSGFNKSYYGFNTFRRGRLVTTYDKIGLTPNQEIRQIIGELHIEGIPITHDKKGWLKSSEEYQELERKMREYFKEFERKPKRILSGYVASSGKVAGTVKIVKMNMSGDSEKELLKIKKGDIIVTEMTRPAFLLSIRRSAGIISDLGGSLCHAAIVAREFNIPAVVGTQNATTVLKDGQKVILDGDEGHIYIYEN